MKIYATTDTHFGHEMLVEKNYRPVDFERIILANIKKVQGDLLIHCGDFCIGDDEEWVKRYMEAAKGFKTKVLVRGNHDKKSDVWYIERGFAFVCETFTADYFGKNIIFSHVPCYQAIITLTVPVINVHGHMHGNGHRGEEPKNGMINIDIAPELNNYELVNIEKIKS
jgi:calcineurin-like phosphoesterase family protein